MKIRIDYTVEVDAAVIKELIADYGTDETVHQFVRSYLGACLLYTSDAADE